MTTTPLGYAHRSSAAALPANVRAVALLVPNVLAVIVLFIPLHTTEPPINPIIDYAKQLVPTRGHPPARMTWEAMITGPFLLAMPLALWTIRLSIAARARAGERAIAWSLTVASFTMTLLCIGYCIASEPRRFGLAVVAAIVVLAIGSFGVARLWSFRNAWPTPLLAMTGAWAANATLTIFVVKSHSRWNIGIAIALLVVMMQIVIGGLCVRAWRAASVTPG